MDSLALASRVAGLAQMGRRQSTYKLALLMALVDSCVEAAPEPGGGLVVPLDEITHRIVGYYWPQTRTYHERGRLRQTKTGTSIPDRIAVAREVLAQAGIRNPDAALEAGHPAYAKLIRSL